MTDCPEPITPIPPPPAANPLKLALGESLFEDPLLSRDRTRSCQSCHDTRSNGANTHQHDRAVDGSQLFFNTNTVFNAALSFRFDWEGDMPSLEAHTEASLVSPRTMGMTMDEALGRLEVDPDMVARFGRVYGHGPDQASLLDAIATYERSLVTPGSRFDQWLQGDSAALSADEQKGYQLFKSLGCISCHQGVNIGGNLFERQGIFRPLAAPNPQVLRVPSLRNVAVTPPYFHDGSAPTLEDAVRKMAAAQLDRTLSRGAGRFDRRLPADADRQLSRRPRDGRGAGGRHDHLSCRPDSRPPHRHPPSPNPHIAMKLTPAVAAVPLLLLLLTWLLLQGMNPDAQLSSQAIAALDDFALAESALHRDVLSARAGLLHNYDSLVREDKALNAALDRLHAAAAGFSESRAPIAELAAAVARQEMLTEQFKSDNALLQNSLAYFGLFSVKLAHPNLNGPIFPAVSELAAAMLHLTLDTSPPAAQAVAARLDGLAAQSFPAE